MSNICLKCCYWRLKVLGVIDKDGQPQDPIYATFGKVLSKGSNFSRVRNHATYINEVGYYDIVRMMNDFRLELPAMDNVVHGQVCSHVTAEVDCESLFRP